jgi:hypothetical protein
MFLADVYLLHKILRTIFVHFYRKCAVRPRLDLNIISFSRYFKLVILPIAWETGLSHQGEKYWFLYYPRPYPSIYQGKIPFICRSVRNPPGKMPPYFGYFCDSHPIKRAKGSRKIPTSMSITHLYGLAAIWNLRCSALLRPTPMAELIGIATSTIRNGIKASKHVASSSCSVQSVISPQKKAFLSATWLSPSYEDTD